MASNIALTAITRFPLRIGKNFLTGAIAKGILISSTNIAADPDYEIEIEGLTVEATANQTAAQASATVAGALFIVAIAWARQKGAFNSRLQVMRFLERVINLKKGSIKEAAQMNALTWDKLQRTISVSDAAIILENYDNIQQDLNVIEELLQMGSDTNDLKQGVVFNKNVKETNYLIPSIRQSLLDEGISLKQYSKWLADIVESNNFFSIPENEKMLRSTIFQTDDLLGFRQVIKEQQIVVSRMLAMTADDIVEQSSLMSYSMDFAGDGEVSDEGRWLQKQKKEANKNAAYVDDALEELDVVFDKYYMENGIDPATMKPYKLGQTNPVLGKVTKTTKLKGGARFLGRGLSKFFFWDGILWIGTTAIDVALNPFMAEEEQGFLSDRVGYSVVDEFLIIPLIDYIFPKEKQVEYLTNALIQIAESNATIEGAVFATLLYFVEDINVSLSFDIDSTTTGIVLRDSLPPFDPSNILIGAWGLIVIAELWRSLLVPAYNAILS